MNHSSPTLPVPPIRRISSSAGGDPASPPPFAIRFDQTKTFSTHRVQALKHNYDGHPLLQLDALAELAKALYPTKQCRFIQRDATVASSFDHGDADVMGRSIDEVFRRIEEPGSWVALYNVETHPTYQRFLEEVIGQVRPLIERDEPGVFNVGGFIFVSAPPSVTPFHIDRENNFWLQIRGRKTINVWDPTDRHVVTAKDRDGFVVHANLDPVKLKDGYQERSHEFDVGPGDGVYFPSTSPHMTRSEPGWVEPGNGVSVSIGIVFYTDVTRRSANVHAWNLFLRKLGFEPSDVGTSVWMDRLKYPFGRTFVAFMTAFRGYKKRVGF